MKKIVLDASVIIKWIKPQNEKSLDTANEYFVKQLQGQIRVCAPSLIEYELHNTISRLTDKNPPVLLTFIKNLDITLIPLSDSLTSNGYDLVHQYSISFYDAVYIAVAKSLDCSMITADKKLVNKVKLSCVKLL